VMAAVRSKGKPVVAIAGGGPFTREHSLHLQRAGVPVFPTATRAVSALDSFVWRAEWRNQFKGNGH
jgi:acyl-CoA synthetase (NDP forming)